MKYRVCHLNVVFAIEGVEPLIFNVMAMERRPITHRRRNLHDGERTVRILARNFDGHFAAGSTRTGRYGEKRSLCRVFQLLGGAWCLGTEPKWGDCSQHADRDDRARFAIHVFLDGGWRAA